nr:salicylic acid methyltransferase [Verbascum sp. SAMT]
MEVVNVLHMNGGLGENSYANNSLLQQEIMYMIKPIREEAITELYSSMAPCKSFCIVDMGCSSGPNSLFVAKEFIRIVDKLRRKFGHQLPEFLIHLNDLPGNDFNSIFQSLLPLFQQELRQEIGPEFGLCLVFAVPGSFHGRLFPAKTLHFVHSSYSLMWLSKVPEGLEMNKERICITSKSPKSAVNAYSEQFQRDFSTFLKCRSEEVVTGGKMVLTIFGRKNDVSSITEGSYIWELMAVALREMVAEKVIEEEKFHSFNIHEYAVLPAEVENVVEKEGSFTIDLLEVSEITWASCGNVTMCMRSVAEPLLVDHFGEHIIDPLFDKYNKIIDDRMSKEDLKFINVTVSLTRK